jgi:hypothetical protein
MRYSSFSEPLCYQNWYRIAKSYFS